MIEMLLGVSFDINNASKEWLEMVGKDWWLKFQAHPLWVKFMEWRLDRQSKSLLKS